jgi:hypothetical protein
MSTNRNGASGLSKLQKYILLHIYRVYKKGMEEAPRVLDRCLKANAALPPGATPYAATLDEVRQTLRWVMWKPSRWMSEWNATRRADTSRALQRLEVRGLVERAQSNQWILLHLDKPQHRTYVVALTRLGLEVAERIEHE